MTALVQGCPLALWSVGTPLPQTCSACSRQPPGSGPLAWLPGSLRLQGSQCQRELSQRQSATDVTRTPQTDHKG